MHKASQNIENEFQCEIDNMWFEMFVYTTQNGRFPSHSIETSLTAPFFYSSVATHIEQYSTRATRTHAIIHIQANYNKFSTGFYFLFCSVTFPFQTTIK